MKASKKCLASSRKRPRRRPRLAQALSRPRSEPAGPAAAARSRRRRALTYDDLPNEIKGVIKDYVAFTNASLRAAVKEYFKDKAACERRHGKMGTWDVGRVTDMSYLFANKTFNEDIGTWNTWVDGV